MVDTRGLKRVKIFHARHYNHPKEKEEEKNWEKKKKKGGAKSPFLLSAD